MQGAGGINGTNWINTVGARDGTVLGADLNSADIDYVTSLSTTAAAVSSHVVSIPSTNMGPLG